MNTHDVIVELEKNNIDPRFCSIYVETGPSKDGQFVIDKPGKYTWVVYVIERGERIEEMMFTKEDEACRYFLDLILAKANVTIKIQTFR